jgi:hypothetical protein
MVPGSAAAAAASATAMPVTALRQVAQTALPDFQRQFAPHQAAPQPMAMPEATAAAVAEAVAAVAQPAVGAASVAPSAQQAAHVMPLRQPAQPPASRGLFAEAPRPTAAPANPVAPHPAAPPAGPPAGPEPGRPSLFSQVTGAWWRRPVNTQPAAEMRPIRQEPTTTPVRAEAPQVSSRPMGGDEVSLDIPAFLRRQTS